MDMPSKGAHIALTIVAWMMGPLWGVLSLIQVIGMNKAINSGDAVEAQAKAKKVKLFAFIGIGVNVLFLIIYVVFIIGLASAFS